MKKTLRTRLSRVRPQLSGAERATGLAPDLLPPTDGIQPRTNNDGTSHFERDQTLATRLNGVLYDFSPFVSLYGHEFCIKLHNAWVEAHALSTPSTTEKRWGTLRRFLRWLADRAIQHPNTAPAVVFHHLQTSQASGLTVEQMRDGVEEFAGRIRDRQCMEIIATSNLLSRRCLIETLSMSLQVLAGQGLWPDIGPVLGLGLGQITGGNIPSLGEVKVTSQRGARSTEARDLTIEHDFNRVADENVRCLAALRDCAVAELVEDYEHFKERHLPEGDLKVLLAAYTIVLVDTGFDIGSCDDLPFNPFVGTAIRGKQRIATVSARKARADGKVVDAVLLDGEADLATTHESSGISSVQAIKMWQEMSQPFRDREEAPDKLWSLPRKAGNVSGVLPYLPSSFKNAWNAFLRRHANDSVIGGLPLQRRMIRPTVLQIRAVRNNFDHAIAQIEANHASAGTTFRYLSRPWFKAQLDKQIRAFQNLFEANLGRGIDEFASKLGVAPAELERRTALADETGLGFVCLEPTAGVQPNTTPGLRCQRLEQCTECSLRRFVPTDQALEALVLFNFALKDQEAAFCAANPKRWAEVWMPYLALTEAVIIKLRNSHRKPRLIAAERRVNERRTAGELRPITLW